MTTPHATTQDSTWAHKRRETIQWLSEGPALSTLTRRPAARADAAERFHARPGIWAALPQSPQHGVSPWPPGWNAVAEQRAVATLLGKDESSVRGWRLRPADTDTDLMTLTGEALTVHSPLSAAELWITAELSSMHARCIDAATILSGGRPAWPHGTEMHALTGSEDPQNLLRRDAQGVASAGWSWRTTTNNWNALMKLSTLIDACGQPGVGHRLHSDPIENLETGGYNSTLWREEQDVRRITAALRTLDLRGRAASNARGHLTLGDAGSDVTATWETLEAGGRSVIFMVINHHVASTRENPTWTHHALELSGGQLRSL